MWNFMKFSSKTGNERKMSSKITFIQHCTGSLDWWNKKNIKGIRNGIKISHSFFTDDMIVYVEIKKHFTDKLLNVIIEIK